MSIVSVSRACGVPLKSDGCKEGENGGVACFCSTDLCNSASVTAASALAVIAPLIIGKLI